MQIITIADNLLLDDNYISTQFLTMLHTRIIKYEQHIPKQNNLLLKYCTLKKRFDVIKIKDHLCHDPL